MSIMTYTPQFVVDEDGRKKSVLLPIDAYERLIANQSDNKMSQWQQQFNALITRIHGRTAHFHHDEIEADIADAMREVREERHANRSA